MLPFSFIVTPLHPAQNDRCEPLLTLGGALALGAHQIDDTLVDLDTGQDALLLEQSGQRGTVIALLVQRLVEQNNTGDVLLQTVVGGEQQLTVLAAVVLVVLDADVLQSGEKEGTLHKTTTLMSASLFERILCVFSFDEIKENYFFMIHLLY